MLALDIDGRTFTGPENWDELTFEQYDRLLKIKEPDKDAADTEQVAYYRECICMLFDIPADVADELKVYGSQDSIVDTWAVINEALSVEQAEKIKPLKSFTYEGVKYSCHLPAIDLIGNTTPSPEWTYGEFEEAATINDQYAKMKEGQHEGMPLLMAVLYREAKAGKPKKYNSAEAKKRAEVFRRLPMSKLWGAHFFLMKHTAGSLKRLETYLQETAKAARSQSTDGSPLNLESLIRRFSTYKASTPSKPLKKQS